MLTTRYKPNFFHIMIFKKSIENLVYLGLYILSLILFFGWGNIGNNKIFFSAAHILCACALVINSNRKIASFFLKSFTVFLLISSIIWAANLPFVWAFIPFMLLGFSHIMMLDEKDLFGKMVNDKEPVSMDWLKTCLWMLITLVTTLLFFVV